MIIFCEDCGGRNKIPAEQCQSGNANFQCSVCGYRNSFVIELHTDGRLQSFSRLLENYVTQTPSVIGGFVYRPDTKIKINMMSDFLTDQDLTTLGYYLCDSWNTAANGWDDTKAFRVVIGGKQISVEKNSHGLFLILFSRGTQLPDPIGSTLRQSFGKIIF